MGHSASIAKKYSPSNEPSKKNRGTEAQTDNDEDQELASVASFRPNSPAAHSDARSFTLDSPRRQPREPVGYCTMRSPSNGNRALVPYVSREPSYATINGTIPSSLRSSQFRTMRDVRNYIQSNPDLLVKKKQEKKEQRKVGGFDDIMAPHKQIKTKQRVYLSLINPPIIYAMGARPNDSRLRVNQDVYLHLVNPTQDRLHYKEQAYRTRTPLQHNGMVVVRKDDHFRQQNGHVRWSKVPASKTYPPQMGLPQLSQRSKASSQNLDRTLALSRAPPRSRQPLPPPGKTRQKQKNQHVPLPPSGGKNRHQNVPSQSSNGRAGSQKSWSGRENGVGATQQGNASPKPNVSRNKSNASEATVEFTFSLEDLNLKKKTTSEVAYAELDKDRGKVVPLYFRKSLAFSPKYVEDDGLLSGPL